MNMTLEVDYMITVTSIKSIQKKIMTVSKCCTGQVSARHPANKSTKILKKHKVQ